MTSTRTRIRNADSRAEESPEQRRDELIEQAASAAPDLADLIRLYYRYIPPEEVNDTDPVDLVGMVRSHRKLADSRVPGRPAVRVFNPDAEADGWSAAGTIVQLVTDDMPYLVESVTAALVRTGLQVHRVVHPIVVVSREVVGGDLKDILTSAEADDPPPDALAESWMSIEVDLITAGDRKKDIANNLKTVLNDVREVVEDTDRMAGTARALADQLESHPPVDEAQAYEGSALLRWLADGHFTFLGYRNYELVRDGDRRALKAVLASGLGVLRQDSISARNLTAGPDGDVDATSPDLLILTEASAPSSVYRSTFPYYVGVKTFAEDGTVTGEHRFLGVFTINALHEDVMDIPVVGRRVREVIHRAGFPLDSYTGQKMLEVIQNWPRSELFSTNSDTLYQTTTGVIALADRRRLRLFLRRDPYGRFFSCLVFTPRDRYTTTSRIAMQNVLIDELGGTHVEFSVRLGETPFAQVYFTVHTDPEVTTEVDVNRIQERLTEAVRTWNDRLVEAVFAEQRDKVDAGVTRARDQLVAVGAESATEQGQRFASVFPEAYKEDFPATDALTDLRSLEGLRNEGDLAMSFYRSDGARPGERRLKLYLAGEGVTLSQMLPVLQNMGVEVVDERPYELRRDDGTRWWIYDFGLRIDPAVVEEKTPEQQQRQRGLFQDAFGAIWRGDAESDRFNSLVLGGGLSWRQAALLRAYSRYLRQAGVPFDQGDVEDALLDHTDVAVALVTLFETRFDLRQPDEVRDRAVDTRVAEITTMIDEVTSLDADRILRSLLALLRATLRTNYNVRDEHGDARPYLALKLDPAQVLDLPEPRPKFEIFVYSPRVEGVHLRFGSVARGGLRWSDRRSDFRTEILGLVKAQAVKNAVIVPVGAKGGFVVKRPPAGDDREAFLAEGIACYRMFISGLLDLTDNLRGGEVVPARDVVRYDADDTYLVVAADKGTATFSDIANEVAAEYGFWLGDAFASGGSVGYDHKAMGITARGAWESVKRHFRELGKDTQTEDFTVVGIGDMAGDVFGNGMLLSEHIRLVAGFNHMHVFIDPNPDAATSYAERRRLFELPRSSWDDYDRSLISEGGGVWPRTLKSIPVSEQARVALGLPDGVVKLSPPELMKAILLSQVDLLWNGGIGTYVKAAGETHADVGDKANDALRVDGADLRVKVVGEGGNLGLTQRGRIEFAKAGGKVNTDALDNSAGVDCSDHEVNIKILLDHLVTAGVLAKDQRNELLAEMTDEVAHLVLADNYSQNAVLGVSRAHAREMLTVLARLVTDLEDHSGLDRKLEALPNKQQFRDMDKRGEGLTSPELATLLAHVKLRLKQEVLASELPDADVFARRLPQYFPTQLQERFGEAVPQHPLSRQITTTLLVNEVVDGGGVSYAFRLAEEMNASATDAVRAFTAVTEIFDLKDLWRQIQTLDNVVPTEVADHMTLETRRLLDRASRWLLSNRPQPLAVGAEINRFHDVIAELVPEVPGMLRGTERETVAKSAEKLVTAGAPVELSRRVASLLDCYPLLDVIEVAELADRDSLDTERSPRETAELYYALSDHLDIDSMLTAISGLERGNRWHALARLALRDDLYSSLRAITLDVLRQSDPGTSADEKIVNWERGNVRRISRSRESLEEIRRVGRLDLATLSVATRQVRSMVR